MKQIVHRLRGALGIVNRKDISTQLQKLEIELTKQQSDKIHLDEWKNICNRLEQWIRSLNEVYD
ncbi:TPA: hypothetical protein OUB44_004212 [Providencia rettgeri]|nr:hypothetical protein [Providencia rettgeri]